MIAADVNAYWALGHHAAHFEWSDKTLCLGHGSNKGGKGKRNRSMWSRPDLPCVMLTDHWVATHIIASVSDQPNGRRYSVFSCKSNCISCTLVGPCAHWTWASILETSSWLSSRSPHTSLVFLVIRQLAGKIPWADIMMSENLYLFSTFNIYCSIYKCADFFLLNLTESNLPESAWLPLLNNDILREIVVKLVLVIAVVTEVVVCRSISTRFKSGHHHQPLQGFHSSTTMPSELCK